MRFGWFFQVLKRSSNVCQDDFAAESWSASWAPLEPGNPLWWTFLQDTGEKLTSNPVQCIWLYHFIYTGIYIYIYISRGVLYLLFVWKQGNRHEGHDSCKRPSTGSEDVQEDVLLHHAGWHATATPHCTGGHDGEKKQTPVWSLNFSNR